MEWYYGSCKEENLQKGKSEEYRSGTLKKDRGEGVNSAASAAYLNNGLQPTALRAHKSAVLRAL